MTCKIKFYNEIFNLALNDLQDKVLSMGGRKLSGYGFPQPQAVDNNRFARVYRREINYDQGKQQAYVDLQYAHSRPARSLRLLFFYDQW